MKNTVKNMLIASITCVVVSLSMMTSAVAEDNFKEGTTIYGGGRFRTMIPLSQILFQA